MISEKPVNLATFDFFSFSEPPFRGLVTFIGRFWPVGHSTVDDGGFRYAGWTTSSYLCLLQSTGSFHHIEIAKGHGLGGNYNRVHDRGPCDCRPGEPVGRIRLSLAD